MILIGIDPGASGGIASYDTFTKQHTAKSMPKTDTDILEHLRQFDLFNTDTIILMELVTGFIGKKKRVINIQCYNCHKLIPYEIEEADPASSMFKFGNGYGFLRGVCTTLGFRFEKPMTPKSWQKIHGLYKPKGISQYAWKNILKDRAQKLYPELKVTLATADALLILDVLKRIPRF